MRNSFAEYERLVKDGTLKTDEEKRAFFSDRPAAKMTVQDPRVMDRVVQFIKE